MKNCRFKLPVVIFAIGLVLCIAVSLLTGLVKEPIITEQDFDFSVTYRLNGETQTYNGVYRCTYTGTDVDPRNRYYTGTFLTNADHYPPAAYPIAQQDDQQLCIVTIFSDCVLMGDGDGRAFHYDPYLAVFDKEGYEYDDEETLSVFDAEIIEWQYPAAAENRFVFTGFSKLYEVSMFSMLAVGLLVILACMIFVKKDASVTYQLLDKASVAFNFLMVLIAIPFIAILVAFMQLVVTGDELWYQICLCLPALTAFAVAASIVLRRKGAAKGGFFVQFVGPVLFVLLLVLESIL